MPEESTAETTPINQAEKAGTANTVRTPLYEIRKSGDAFQVTMPGGISDIGVVAFRDQTFPTEEEVQEAIEASRAKMGDQIEYASLQRSFSSFRSITHTEDGKYNVVFPAFYSLENPAYLVGTSSKVFDSWEEAKVFYLEMQNKHEYPTNAVFRLKIGNVDYTFEHLKQFGQHTKLTDKPLLLPEETKEILDFDRRNTPDSESAHTYYETLKIPQWEGQVFYFVTTYMQTEEGKAMAERLGIKDLRLLTPQQAASLALEMVTRLRKYNLDEIDSKKGQIRSDQMNVLTLLSSGLHRRGDKDFRGNGICRNFASTVKAVFDSIKANQTRFNYLNDTYCFFEGGSRADYNPEYEKEEWGTVSMTPKASGSGHAWNSFVTIQAQSASQTVVDATWSSIDYDTQEVVHADFTLQRMEKDVFRNLASHEEEIAVDDAVGFYTFLVDSLPRSGGIVLSDEMKYRIRQSGFYSKQRKEIERQYPGLSDEQYDDFTMNVYKIVTDEEEVDSRTQFYLTRAMKGIRGKEDHVSEQCAAELVKLVADKKKDVEYFELESIFSLSGGTPEDKIAAAKKYVQGWEVVNKKRYIPLGNLIFRNPVIQEAVIASCSSDIQKELIKEIEGRKRKQ